MSERREPAWTQSGRVAVIAGEGRMPLEIAQHLQEHGHRPPFVILSGSDEGTEPALRRFDHEFLPLEGAARLVPILKRAGVSHAVLAGGITRRPRWQAFLTSWRLIGLLPRILNGLRRGDDGLLRVLVEHLEEHGIPVLGAHEVMPDLLAAAGPLTASKPGDRDRRDLEAGLAAARAIGALDIGQAAVAIGGRAIALEGIEGTDGLLQRVAALRSHGRLAGATGGVLVKCAKPGQELRADLPAIGPETVTRAHEAGLAGIGVEAGRSLVLDQARTVAEANRLRLFITGLT